MSITKIDFFGNSFERIFFAMISVISGIFLICLAIMGHAFLGQIQYKTAEVVNNQLIGQDIVNLFLVSLLLIIGEIELILRNIGLILLN